MDVICCYNTFVHTVGVLAREFEPIEERTRAYHSDPIIWIYVQTQTTLISPGIHIHWDAAVPLRGYICAQLTPNKDKSLS